MSKLSTYVYFIFSLSLLMSCSYFQQTNNKQAIAKAGSYYLYAEDIPADVFSDNPTEEDSTASLNRYIDKWALKHVMLDKAKFNLPKNQQEEYNQMAEQYRIQLYINAYKDALIDKNFSPSFSEEEIVAYYEEKKANFKLKENLLKLRYLAVKTDFKGIDEIKSKFFSFIKEDDEYLQGKKLEFKMLMLNDSVWVRFADVLKQFPSIQEDFSKHVTSGVQKSAVFQDSLFTYMVFVNETLVPNEIPPISYLKPTIEQILENKKKLELNKQLEKDILNDAIQNNDFKTY